MSARKVLFHIFALFFTASLFSSCAVSPRLQSGETKELNAEKEDGKEQKKNQDKFVRTYYDRF